MKQVIKTDVDVRAESLLVPRRCTLEGFAEAVALTGGIGLAELGSLTTLLVQTQNSLYRITVIEPLGTRVLVQGGRFFTVTTEACLNGSGFGGSFLKMAWVGPGLRMEICYDNHRIVTSPVRSIEIEKDRSLPGPF